MKIKYHIFKSQYYSLNFFLCNSGAAIIIFLCHFGPYPIEKNILLLYITWFLFNYIFLFFFYYIFYFYEYKIVRVFIFRPFFREKVIFYDYIYKIKFKNIIAKGEFPRFIIYKNEKKSLPLFNTIYLRKKSNRVKIIKFLINKNVTLEVRTEYKKKDKEIIDLVRAKYPENVFVNPSPHYWYKQKGYL